MPDIGETLRDARMRARLDVADIEAATKIRAKYIRAIENEEWGLLPGSTFVKSFIRTYAEYLGLDAKMLVEDFKLRHEGVSDLDLAPIGGVARPAERGRSRQRRSGRPTRAGRRVGGGGRSGGGGISRGSILGAVILLIVVLLVVIGFLSDEEKPAEPATTPAPTTAAVTPPQPTTTAERPAPKPTQVTLQIRPAAEVPVCLRDEEGALIVDEVLTPATDPRTYRDQRLKVTVGNSSVVLVINGERRRVQDGSTTLELKPGSTEELPESQTACE